MVPAAFEQFAVRVTAEATVGDETDAETEQPKLPGAEVWQVSEKLPPPLSVRLNELQLESLRLIDAACEGVEAGTASKAVTATAASVHAAARKSGRFIF